MKNTNESEIAKEISREILNNTPFVKNVAIRFNYLKKGKIVTKLNVQVKKKIFHIETVAYDILDSISNAKEIFEFEFNNYFHKNLVYIKKEIK